jgi:threonine/homoserine/homoserine lactone efflux protein
MKAKELSAQQELKNDEESRLEIDSEAEQISADKPTGTIKEKRKSKNESNKPKCQTGDEEKKSVFVNGLAVGVGTGFIATFVVMWIAVFFSPQLPAGTTYQTMISIFIYPLVYLLAVGSISLTAGIVRQYYARQNGQAHKL